MALLIAAAGCGIRTHGHVAVSPSERWQPAAGESPMPIPDGGPPPPPLPPAGSASSLSALVSIALQNNPRTRIAYYQARDALAGIGNARSQYFPTVAAMFGTANLKNALAPNQIFIQRTYGPSIALNWLLLDLGGRDAAMDEARLQLISANETQNSAIADTLLQVEQAYYAVQSAKALRDSARASVKESEENLAAATDRNRAGVATIADVLQAKTSLSQARLALTSEEGQIAVRRGTLARVLGLHADAEIEVGDLPADLPIDASPEPVEQRISDALAQRPEINGSRAAAERAKRHIATIRAVALPSVALSATGGREFYFKSLADQVNVYDVQLTLQIPIFYGLREQYQLRSAREQARVAAEQARNTEQDIVLQVWTSYETERTATQRIVSARDLLASATESEQVALGRYRSGVGSVLDLVTAQAALASARSQEVQARADWLTAVAALAHDTGNPSTGLEP